jgi:coenzyme F420-reducing hydrogenase delta subunit
LTITNLRVVQGVCFKNVEKMFLADALSIGKEIVVRKGSVK